MEWKFVKYHGTGNDFIMIDDRDEAFDVDNHGLIESLCQRRFGIGADGLILIRLCDGYDFEMVYFNADGRQTSMCGNGGRCAVAFASEIGIIGEQAHFKAIDGEHHATVSAQAVTLGMNDIDQWEEKQGVYIMDTGSPHYVTAGDLGDGFVEQAHAIRQSPRFADQGINVNFVVWDEQIRSRTYERGVEGETYSCGTGAVAIAISAALRGYQSPVSIDTRGGSLSIQWMRNEKNGFQNIQLTGPTTRVFEGIFDSP